MRSWVYQKTSVKSRFFTTRERYYSARSTERAEFRLLNWPTAIPTYDTRDTNSNSVLKIKKKDFFRMCSSISIFSGLLGLLILSSSRRCTRKNTYSVTAAAPALSDPLGSANLRLILSYHILSSSSFHHHCSPCHKSSELRRRWQFLPSFLFAIGSAVLRLATSPADPRV